MRHLLFSLILLPFLAEAQDTAYVRAMIDSLCSHRYGGRGYVNQGDIKASAFIQRQCEAIGLRPLDGGFFQDFKFDVNTFPGAMSVKANGLPLVTGKDFIIKPTSPGLEGKFEAFYFKPSMAKSREKIFQLATSGKLRETMVVLEVNKKIAAYQSFLSTLDENPLNAAGYLLMTDQKLTWSVGRTPGKSTIITAAQDAFPKKIKTLEVDIDQYYDTDYQTRNVIAIIPGQSDSTVVFTAHYDHLGYMGQDVYVPGANDNASGTAMLLDLARYYKEHPMRYTAVFMWFAAEEAGLVGSSYYVEHPLLPLEKIRFLLNLDLMGDAKTGITVVNGKVFSDHFARLSSLNAELGLLGTVNSRGSAANSDHYPFYMKGVPSFFIYTMGDYKHYHDINDKPGNLPLTNYTGVFNLLVNFVDYGL